MLSGDDMLDYCLKTEFEVILLNLSVEFVIKAEKLKTENKHMTAMFIAFPHIE